MSINRKIAYASIIIIAVSLGGHALSLFKEILVAARFGIIKDMDAYYAAIAFPNLAVNIVISAFVAVFIPSFIRYRIDHASESDYAISNVLNCSALALVALAGTVYFCAPALIRFGFAGLPAETGLTTLSLLQTASPLIFLSGMAGILSGYLNSDEQFFWPAMSQILVTVCVIAAILLLFTVSGVHVLVFGTLAGVFLQLMFLLTVAKLKGFRYRAVIDLRQPLLSEIAGGSLVLLVIAATTQLNMLTDRIMASYLPQGSIAALGYADKLTQVPLIIISGSIATALFPYLSMQAANNKTDDLRSAIVRSIRMSGFIFIPLTVFLILTAKPIIRLLFERGAFNNTATELTSVVFICYSFQFFFYQVVLLLGRVLFALKRSSSYLTVALLGVGINLILDLVLMHTVRPPVAGIALSTSAVLLIMSIILLRIVSGALLRIDWRPIVTVLLSITGIAAIMGAMVLTFINLAYHRFLLPDSIIVTAAALIAFSAFFGLSLLFRLNEPYDLLRLLRPAFSLMRTAGRSAKTESPADTTIL